MMNVMMLSQGEPSTTSGPDGTAGNPGDSVSSANKMQDLISTRKFVF